MPTEDELANAGSSFQLTVFRAQLTLSSVRKVSKLFLGLTSATLLSGVLSGAVRVEEVALGVDAQSVARYGTSILLMIAGRPS